MKRVVVCPRHSQYQCLRRFTPQPFGARLINCRVVFTGDPMPMGRAEWHVTFRMCPRFACVSGLGDDNRIVPSYAYKRTYATRHTRMNTLVPILVRTHARTPRSFSVSLSHMHTLHAQARTYAHTHTHSCTHTHHTQTHTQRAPPHTHTNTRMRGHSPTDTQTQARKYYTHARTRTHTHTTPSMRACVVLQTCHVVAQFQEGRMSRQVHQHPVVVEPRSFWLNTRTKEMFKSTNVNFQ